MYSILVIEDNAIYINMMETILRTEGFYVATALDGQSGLDAIRKKRPDLILCDILMPGMDGHSVLDNLRQESEFSDLPFIFVTAKGERSDVRQGMSAGADDYLPKPFSAEELIAAVIACLNRRETVRKHFQKTSFQEERTVLEQKTTVREREVLQLVGRGFTSQQIAERLGISLRTVQAHRTNLMEKLNVDNAAMLARWAIISEQLQDSPVPSKQPIHSSRP